MCSGEFLEASLECIRREIEICDGLPILVVTHSLAGGTGSGLGTRITEACCDEFSDVTRINLAITPYHFGEVVVQHYNALFSLSKISSASHATSLFENEVAQDLCKQMKGIERPTLDDINGVISSNIIPSLLPKFRYDPHRSFSTLLCDDIANLCAHPGYRFLDVKNVPQTSAKSIEFTYDAWSSLVNTLAKMQMKGTASERGLGSSTFDPRNACPTIGSILTLSGKDSIGAAASTVTSRVSLDDPSQGRPRSKSSGSTKVSATAVGGDFSISSGVGKHGGASSGPRVGDDIDTLRRNPGRFPDALFHEFDTYFSSREHEVDHVFAGIGVVDGLFDSGASLPGTVGGVGIGAGRKAGGAGGAGTGAGAGGAGGRSGVEGAAATKHFFLAPYCAMLERPLTICHSPLLVNDYQRSASLLSNSAAVLPLLQRVVGKASDLYGARAYVHQYTPHGLEEEDFVTAFRNVGQVVQNYRSLSLPPG